ncbi:MAG: adenylosuccinate lyase [Actinomycetota bacterium]|nr:adenylosuccinate lyase [Actinomycetota bacterium]
MIDRYTLPRMGKIWSEEEKMGNWLRIEVLACEAMAKNGLIPPDALKAIKQRARFDPERVKEIEKRTRHDVVAFIENVSENVGEEGRFLHFGLTSSDILDTGLALQTRDAIQIIIEDTLELLKVLKEKAFEYRGTQMMGRTHGVHAEPTTFGAKLAVWAFETRRNLDRLVHAMEAVSYGKLSGAVGTYGSVSPDVEKYVCEKLSLKPAEASSQILQRDRHAEYLCALAIAAGSLEKFATEIRNLQRTEISEAGEPFRKGQTGSSAMPHKRNPIICERICGLARVVRGNAMVGLQNMALWHERDISHSSAERVILPDSTALVDYIAVKFIEVMRNLRVYPERMRENIDMTNGLVFSEKVLLSLIKKGLTRQEAYEIVQRNAMRASEGEGNFKEMLLRDEEVREHLDLPEIEACFDVGEALSNISAIFERLEALSTELP